MQHDEVGAYPVRKWGATKECKEENGIFRMENNLKESNTEAKQNKIEAKLGGGFENPDQ